MNVHTSVVLLFEKSALQSTEREGAETITGSQDTNWGLRLCHRMKTSTIGPQWGIMMDKKEKKWKANILTFSSHLFWKLLT